MSKEKQIEELLDELIRTNGYGTLNAVANHLYNAGYRKQSEGISVDERLPERGESVLVYSSKYDPIVECRDLVTYMRMGNYSGVTHWMPLPEPPKGD